jgi:hypothetical protein
MQIRIEMKVTLEVSGSYVHQLHEATLDDVDIDNVLHSHDMNGVDVEERMTVVYKAASAVLSDTLWDALLDNAEELTKG